MAATTSLLCLVITAAALAAIQEQRSNQELYRAIYYDQGFVHQPIKINNIEELPSLNFQVSQQNESNIQEVHEHAEEITKFPTSFYNSAVVKKDSDPSENLKGSSEKETILGILEYSQNDSQHNASEYPASENEMSKDHEIHAGIATGNVIKSLEDVTIDDVIINSSTDRSGGQDSMILKRTDVILDVRNGELSSDYPGNGDRHNSGVTQDDPKTKSEVLQGPNVRNETNGETTHIMRIANTKTSKTNYVFSRSLNDHDLKLDPPANTDPEGQFNRPKKSADHYQREDLLDNNDGHHKTVITDDEHIYPKFINNDEAQDIMTFPSIQYESEDEENVSEIINNLNDFNQTLLKFPSLKQKLQRQEQPQYEEVPKSNREVRTVIAINILVASALELAWSLLSASIAWKGMRNCYPHGNGSNSKRTVEGLERSPSPPPCSDDTNKRHHKIDGIFRKPDIISNHQHCHPENSIHLRAVQNKNDINRLHVLNTVSERINIEPYLPMEESTMEYQERVRRFLASNSVVTNTSDSASNIDS